MEQQGEFPAPGPDDYANVSALNSAFIKATTALKSAQRGRLAAAPFLLFSLREDDIDWWNQVLDERRQPDLMLAPGQDLALRRIQMVALSFLWQLCSRNPYAVRAISGAATAWCDKVAGLPLMVLLDRAGGREDLVASRIHGPIAGADLLIDGGTNSESTVRRSSQIAVLQKILMRPRTGGPAQRSAAACSMSLPMRVSEKKL